MRVLGVLAVLAAVGVWQYRDVSDTQRARVDGLAAATAITPQLCTLDYRTLTRDTENAERLTAGDFTTQYHALVDGSVEPNAAGQQLVTKATARASALVSADRDEVVALVSGPGHHQYEPDRAPVGRQRGTGHPGPCR